MKEECLFIGSVQRNGGEYLTIARMIMKYLNTHKKDFKKLSHTQYPYEVIDIEDFNYIEIDTNEKYYTVMCRLELDGRTHLNRITIGYEIVDRFFRKEKIDKIMGGFQKSI